MATRRLIPYDKSRSSTRIGVPAALPPDAFDGLVSDVQAAAVEEDARAARKVERDSAPWYRRPASAGLLVALAVATWGAQAFFMQVREPSLSTHDSDVALRFTIAQQVARIEDFRLVRHRLPASLAEVSETYQGMTYVVLDSLNYLVSGTRGKVQLAFNSDSSLKAFIGSSVQAIRDSRK